MDLRDDDFLSALATALQSLGQRPDGHGRWVTRAVQTLEARRPPALAGCWRRLGLARDLAGLAGLSAVDTADLTLGLFLEGLLAEPATDDDTPPRAWLDYLRLNEDWLASAIHIAQIVHGAERAESRFEAVASVAASYDRKTRPDQLRPMSALTALREEEMTDHEERIVELLWSEAGQALCDRHFRSKERGYPLGSSDIREALLLLKTTKRATTSAEGELGRSGYLPASASRAPEPRRLSADAAIRSESFERRKAQLRGPEADGPIGGLAEDGPPSPAAGDNAPDSDWRLPESVQPEPRPAVAASTPDPEEQAEEGDLMDTTTSPHAHAEHRAAEEQLEQLRASLTQINSLTGQALDLLRSLEPDIHRNARLAAELNAMVQRLGGDSERASDAA